MDAIRIQLCVFWIALMLTYLLGDVIRIFIGDFTPGEMSGKKATPGMWLACAIIMMLPIVMVVLCVTAIDPIVRWASIILAILLFIFNLMGLPTYKSIADKFLIVVGLIINIVIVCFAWMW
jgi:Zn-dependent protease with chaperone function